jgi:hypothetical protein
MLHRVANGAAQLQPLIEPLGNLLQPWHSRLPDDSLAVVDSVGS